MWKRRKNKSTVDVILGSEAKDIKATTEGKALTPTPGLDGYRDLKFFLHHNLFWTLNNSSYTEVQNHLKDYFD